MKLGIIRLTMFAVLAASLPVTSGAADNKKEAQATLLDENSIPCSNCFFGAADYFFCFSVDNKVVIGRDRVASLNWRDPNHEYLGKYYSAWKLPATPGQTTKIEYDDQHVWIPRADGKMTRLTQVYTRDIFINNQQCRDAVHAPQQPDSFKKRLFTSYGVKDR